MKNLKRIIGFMFVLIFSCSMFVGCGRKKGIDETRQYVIFTVFKERAGVRPEEDKYKVDSDKLKKVQYEYDPEITYSIRADVYYVENNEPTGAYKQGSYYTRAGDKIGETTMYMQFCYNGWYTNAEFTLEVIRTLVTPEVSFDPNGAISYVENESYTYEYDGNYHYPLIRLSYNNEEIELKDGGDNIEDSELEGGDGRLNFPDEVGTFIVRYKVAYDDDFVNEKDKGKFKSIDITIKVIIIEKQN